MSDAARTQASSGEANRPALLAHALKLSWISIWFGVVSGSLSVGSGLADHSLGVLAAGLSVLADVTGSIVLVWRFRAEQTSPEHAARVEERAAVAVATALGIVAVALAFESIHALATGSHPGGGSLSVISAAASIVVLVPLAYVKRQTAIKLESHALKGDSTLSAIGASTAVLALLGLFLNYAFGWWWSDRAVALVIAAVAVIEARTLLTAERAGD